jgi:cobalt/nickel transport system permease protein
VHIPDGFIENPTALAAVTVAAGGVALCLRRARRTMDDRTAPLAGLTAAYIFAVQMLNFPVGAGTSGHLLGGALAAILVGPWVGALVVSVVLVMQALLFADGGLVALGLNIINMAFVTVAVGWLAFRVIRRVTPDRVPQRRGIVVAAGLAGFLSVPAAALAFSAEYAIGGAGTFSASTVLVAMTGVHLLIGVGEGMITALTVAAVMASRPDLVLGARSLRAPAAESAPKVAAMVGTE